MESEERIAKTQSEVAELAAVLKAERTRRKEREEYEMLSKKINTFPSREALHEYVLEAVALWLTDCPCERRLASPLSQCNAQQMIVTM